ncbi:MerR family transcriptional regulator [Streptomyces sp. NPDC048611]|uniref:MerR family transcriptional regulator n=1 Tax=Streptomyces sp. NPDC048611 TaxID=3155635 RepID=UPI00343AABD5
MTEQPPTAPSRAAEYRIEDLAHLSGATVRTIRAYQDRGLLPRPERRGRANVYGDAHLARLRQIADLLDRGYTLASIKELLEAWDAGRDLGGVLGLVAEIDGPWTDEKASRISRTDLEAAFGGSPDETALAEAVELGVLERIPGQADEFLVPSPQELAVATELHSAGVPLTAVSGHLREVRGQVEHIAARFLDFTTEHVFQPYLDHPPTEAEAAEATALVRRLRPLAQQTIDAELARAMRTLATRYLRHHLSEALPAETRMPAGGTAKAENGPGTDAGADARAGAGADSRAEAWSMPTPRSASSPPTALPTPPLPAPGATTTPRTAAAPMDAPPPGLETVLLPAEAVQAVRDLVGAENTTAFIAAAAHREAQARTMDALVTGRTGNGSDGGRGSGGSNGPSCGASAGDSGTPTDSPGDTPEPADRP